MKKNHAATGLIRLICSLIISAILFMSLPPISIHAAPVTSIVVSDDSGLNAVQVGHALQMSAAILPLDASSRSVTWEAIDLSGMASIDENGLLTGLQSGLVSIRATAADSSGIYGEAIIKIYQDSLSVYNETELIQALNNSSVTHIKIENDINIIEYFNVVINGSDKSIDGQGHTLAISDFCEMSANDRVYNIHNLNLDSSQEIRITLNGGGSISKVYGTNLTIRSQATTTINDSSLSYIHLSNAPSSHILNCSVMGQGILIEDANNTVIDHVNVIMGATQSNGITLDGIQNIEISHSM